MTLALAALLSGALYPAVTVTSDYRYQGFSESRGRPALQGYLHWYRPDGNFAGVFATGVNFGYPGAPHYEIDLYGGHTFSFDHGRSELKLQGLYTSYPDNRTPGPSFDFVQASAQLQHVQGRWTTIGVVAYTPQGSYGAGPLTRLEAESDYALTPTVSLKALAGRQGVGRSRERTYWSLGVAGRFKQLTLELRYVATDRSRQTCGYPAKSCDAAVVGSVSVSLPPLKLGGR